MVRTAFEALVDGDIEAVVSASQPDVELIPLLTALSGESYKGHDGLRSWHAQFHEVFEGLASRLHEVTEHGDVVIAEGDLVAVGAGSTPTISQPVAWVVTMRDGKASRIEVFADRAEARRRAGLGQ